jgi:hypothetical protein
MAASKSVIVQNMNLQYLIAFTFGILMFFISGAAANLFGQWLTSNAGIYDSSILAAAGIVVNSLIYAAGLMLLMWLLQELGFKATSWTYGLAAILAGGLVLMAQFLTYGFLLNTDLSTRAIVALELTLFACYGLAYGVSLWAAHTFNLPVRSKS